MSTSALVPARATARAPHTRVTPTNRANKWNDRVVSHCSAGARVEAKTSVVPPRRFSTRLAGARWPRRNGRSECASAVDDPGASGDGQDGLISRSGTAMEPNALRDWSHVTYDWLYHSIEADLGYLDQFEKDEIYAATKIAFIAHDGQRRKSGEPFIMHPVAVAQILAQQKMDHETVVAGLLHDTVEDTDHVTFESIQERFGPAVRRIVEGETKVSKVSSSVSKKKDAGAVGGSVDGSADDTPPTTQNVQADDLREMFLAMTQEVRVIIVKLADRLHNMRTLESLKPEKRVKIANETLLVFAPLAKLLGMYQVKNELEELAFKWASPEAYAEAGRRLDELSKQQEPTMFRCAAELQKLCDDDPFLKQACAKVVVIPRAKELYGVYRKSQANGGVAKREKNGDGRSVKNALSVVNDVAQLRVVLDLEQKISPPPPGIEPRTVSSNPPTERQSTRVCYHVLGLVHERWPPVPGRMNDYIATPKLNGYRALHTVVLPIGDDQKIVSVSANEKEKANADLVFPIELQIRTGEMHAMAERGIAADPEVVGAWRVAARRTARRLIRERTLGEGLVVGDDGSNDSDESPSSESQAHETNSDHDDTDDTDGTDDEVLSPEDRVLIRAGHARQVAWLSNIREWQEEFLGVLTAEEFVDTVTGDLLGRRVFVFTPNGGVMNLPHGATVVDFAFYTDRGLDAVRCSVNGVSSDFDRVLRNADVVEIGRDGGAAWKDSIGGEQKEKRNGSNTYGMEFGSGDGSVDLSTDESSDIWEGGTAITADGEDHAVRTTDTFGSASQASAAAIASAVRKQKVQTQLRFLQIAKTRRYFPAFPESRRLFYLSAGDCCPYIEIYNTDTFLAKLQSARAKIKKFLAENGAGAGVLGLDSAGDRTGSNRFDTPATGSGPIDPGVVTDEVIAAAELLLAELLLATQLDSATGAAEASTCFRRFGETKIALTCSDQDGLLRGISSLISGCDGCSIVGYGGESVAGSSKEFLMTYTIVLVPRGGAAARNDRSSLETADDGDGKKKENATLTLQRAQSTVLDFDARLGSLFKALLLHDRVLDARVFCVWEP